MSDEVLRYEVSEGVAEITLDRADRLNALTFELIDAFCDATARAAHDDAVRAVLVTGAGRGFCAGADIKDMMAKFMGGLTEPPQVTFHKTAGRLHDGIATLRRMPKPSIGAINGPAAGAGVGYALASDIVWAAKSATFKLAYSAIGLAPDGGTTQLVTRSIGERKALELFYTAEEVPAEEAQRLGFCSRVVEDEKLVDEARAFARKLAKGPGLSYAKAKSLVSTALTEGLESQMELERAAIVATSGSEDFMEGIQAFLQKREPDFKGR